MSVRQRNTSATTRRLARTRAETTHVIVTVAWKAMGGTVQVGLLHQVAYLPSSLFDFVDIDECNRKLHNCNHNANCKNSYTSFSCHCNPGYLGDGVSCERMPLVLPTCVVICSFYVPYCALQVERA